MIMSENKNKKNKKQLSSKGTVTCNKCVELEKRFKELEERFVAERLSRNSQISRLAHHINLVNNGKYNFRDANLTDVDRLDQMFNNECKARGVNPVAVNTPEPKLVKEETKSSE